jgi:hypothetical protein
LYPTFRNIYNGFRGLFDGLAKAENYLCKSTSEGLFYYALIFYQTAGYTANVVLSTYYFQKVSENYSVLGTVCNGQQLSYVVSKLTSLNVSDYIGMATRTSGLFFGQGKKLFNQILTAKSQ